MNDFMLFSYSPVAQAWRVGQSEGSGALIRRLERPR